MATKFLVMSSPHIKSEDNTRTIMLTVILSLLFPLVFACFRFGLRALVITAVAVISCILFEFLYNMLVKKPQTIGDFSAAVTGILLAFNLPSAVALWIPVAGSFFAIVIVKMLFGGLGNNFMNPALAARAFLLNWPDQMTSWPDPYSAKLPLFSNVNHVDMISTATPLNLLKSGSFDMDNIMDLLLGNKGGSMGEVSIVLLTIGGVFLLLRKVITWHIPVSFIGTVALISFLFPQFEYSSMDYMLAQTLSGGLFLGAIFMATDYSTSPVTSKGRLLFGIGCGLITVIIRRYGGYPEGVCYSILIMNLFTWFLDKYTASRRFGTGGAAHVR